MATIHLLFGPVGSGKTTHGRALAAELGAAFFCLDEWMAALFMMDAPVPLARQLIALGVDVVHELGFFKRAQRDRVRALVAGAGVEASVHVLEVPREVRRERVRARNQGSTTFTIEVDDAMFDWAEAYDEPLGEDELLGARVVRP
jgi:predicted kinase